MRRTRSLCCARAANGHIAAAPARTVMNSRRLIATPENKIIVANRCQECLLWVKSGHFPVRERCLPHPCKRTLDVMIGMSARGQQRARAPQQTIFDHLVGASRECWWYLSRLPNI